MHVNACAHACTHTYMHTCPSTHMHAHICVHAHIHRITPTISQMLYNITVINKAVRLTGWLIAISWSESYFTVVNTMSLGGPVDNWGTMADWQQILIKPWVLTHCMNILSIIQYLTETPLCETPYWEGPTTMLLSGWFNGPWGGGNTSDRVSNLLCYLVFCVRL